MVVGVEEALVGSRCSRGREPSRDRWRTCLRLLWAAERGTWVEVETLLVVGSGSDSVVFVALLGSLRLSFLMAGELEVGRAWLLRRNRLCPAGLDLAVHPAVREVVLELLFGSSLPLPPRWLCAVRDSS